MEKAGRLLAIGQKRAFLLSTEALNQAGARIDQV
jgi:hypothetical protein